MGIGLSTKRASSLPTHEFHLRKATHHYGAPFLKSVDLPSDRRGFFHVTVTGHASGNTWPEPCQKLRRVIAHLTLQTRHRNPMHDNAKDSV